MYKEAGVGAVLAVNPRPPLLVPERETRLLTCDKAVRNCEYKEKLSVIVEDNYAEALKVTFKNIGAKKLIPVHLRYGHVRILCA